MRTFNSQDLEALEKDATGHPDYSDPVAFPLALVGRWRPVRAAAPAPWWNCSPRAGPAWDEHLATTGPQRLRGP